MQLGTLFVYTTILFPVYLVYIFAVGGVPSPLVRDVPHIFLFQMTKKGISSPPRSYLSGERLPLSACVQQLHDIIIMLYRLMQFLLIEQIRTWQILQY